MKLSACSILIGGLVQADYPGYTIPNEPQFQMWKESSDELAFQRNEGKKEFVKYQMPDDEYVPIDHLPIVCKYTSVSTYTFQSSRKKLKTDSFNRGHSAFRQPFPSQRTVVGRRPVQRIPISNDNHWLYNHILISKSHRCRIFGFLKCHVNLMSRGWSLYLKIKIELDGHF